MRWCTGLSLPAIVIALGASVVSAQEATSRLTGLAGENDALVWQAVGRLDADESGFCTATLIAPDFVLTAAHCVFAPQTGEILATEDLTFRAGLRNGSVAAERAISQIEAHPRYRPGTGVSAENIRYDVALLRLAKPIPTHVLDPFLVESREISPGPVSVVSYGRGRAEMPSRQRVCQMTDQRQGVLLLDCNVTFGSSGAPVFSHENGRGRIVSVISGMGVYDGRKVAYGMSLPQVVADLKRQMRANASRPAAAVKRVTVGTRVLPEGGNGAKFVRPGGS